MPRVYLTAPEVTSFRWTSGAALPHLLHLWRQPGLFGSGPFLRSKVSSTGLQICLTFTSTVVSLTDFLTSLFLLGTLDCTGPTQIIQGNLTLLEF